MGVEEHSRQTRGYSRLGSARLMQLLERVCYVTAGTFARRGLGFDSKDTKESEFGFEVLSTKSKKRT